jgi:hypothetical protein
MDASLVPLRTFFMGRLPPPGRASMARGGKTGYGQPDWRAAKGFINSLSALQQFHCPDAGEVGLEPGGAVFFFSGTSWTEFLLKIFFMNAHKDKKMPSQLTKTVR